MDNSKIHILIVDDDDKIRDLLKQYLKNNNFLYPQRSMRQMQKKN